MTLLGCCGGCPRPYTAACDSRDGRGLVSSIDCSWVLGKLGMTHEGRHRHTVWIRDGWRDSDVFSILDQEWHTGPGGNDRLSARRHSPAGFFSAAVRPEAGH